MSGNINDTDRFTGRFLNIVRYTGIIILVPIVMYGIAALNGAVPASILFTPLLLVTISFGFVLFSLWQYFTTDYTKTAIIARLVGFHLFAILYLVFIAGLSATLVVCWFFLLVIAEIFYGIRGFTLSALGLVIAAGTTAVVSMPHAGAPAVTAYLATCLIIIACGLFSVGMRKITFSEHQLLERAQNEREHEREQLLTLINSVGLAIMSTSKAGTIRVYNAALLNLLDTNVSLVGKNVNHVFNLCDKKGEPVELIDIAKDDRIDERQDISLRYDDGEQIRLSILISPLHGRSSKAGEKIEGYIFIMEDITRAKSLEEERDEFISVVSHELRTPLTIAEGNISNARLLLERGADDTLLQDTFKTAHEQIVFLAGMVNDLGTLSRAERGAGDAHEDVDIDNLARELYMTYNPSAENKQLRFNLDITEHLGIVNTSQLYLEEILQNFITNAIKYTKEGSVTLRIKKIGNQVEFSVRDTGIGISKSDQKRIFEKFFRSEDYRTRETNGTGLGLYVVKKLADKLDTKVEVVSRLNHGSTFSFKLSLK